MATKFVAEMGTDSGPRCECGSRIWGYILDRGARDTMVNARCASCHFLTMWGTRRALATVADVRALHVELVPDMPGRAR